MIQFERHILCMEQETGGHFVVQIPTARSVQLSMCLGADHRIERDRVLRLRLEVLYIDLPSDSFVAIEHRGSTLAHLYGFHPWSRDILHTEGLCQSADIRGVLGEHLHIGAAQSEQTDLLSTCSCIGVRHIHTGTGLKTLAQIATCCHTECLACECLGRYRSQSRTQDSHLALYNIYFL